MYRCVMLALLWKSLLFADCFSFVSELLSTSNEDNIDSFTRVPRTCDLDELVSPSVKLGLEIITNTIKEIKKGDKPFLILVGENHYSCNHTNLNILLLKVLQDNGLSTVYIEAPDFYLEEIANLSIYDRFLTGHTIIPIAKGLNYKLIAAESASIRTDEFNKLSVELQAPIRESDMVENILRYKESGIFFTGKNHFLEILRSPDLREIFTIIPIELPRDQVEKEFDISSDSSEPLAPDEILVFDFNEELLHPKYGNLIAVLFPDHLANIFKAFNAENIDLESRPVFLDKIMDRYFDLLQKTMRDESEMISEIF